MVLDFVSGLALMTPHATPARVGPMRTLLIVDDHHPFRAWACRALRDEGFDVIGEAADGVSAIAAVERLRPDVTLLDLVLPDMTGFDVAAAVQERTTVVLTSSRDLSDFAQRPGDAVAGFLPKAEVSGPALERLVGDHGR